MGRTRDAAPGAPPDRPVPQLLAMGLLRRIDADTVILPRHVGQVLRGEEPGPAQLTAPDPVVSQPPRPPTPTPQPPARSSTCCASSRCCSKHSALHRFPSCAAADWECGRSGGWRRSTGIDEARLGLVLEVAAAAGLIASGLPDPEPAGRRADPYWAPTVAADRFAEASHRRALAPAGHHLAGPAGPAGVDRQPRARRQTVWPRCRIRCTRRLPRWIVGCCWACWPSCRAGAGVDTATASAGADLAAAALGQAATARRRWRELLDEAHALGLVGRGAISTPGRALVDGGADRRRRRRRRRDGTRVARADRPLPGAGRPDRRGARPARSVSWPRNWPPSPPSNPPAPRWCTGVSEPSIRHALDIGRTA